MSKSTIFPLIASQYMDTDRWGVVGNNNEIVVAMGEGWDEEKCRRFADAANAVAASTAGQVVPPAEPLDPAYRTFAEFMALKDAPDVDDSASALVGWNACARVYGGPIAERAAQPQADAVREQMLQDAARYRWLHDVVLSFRAHAVWVHAFNAPIARGDSIESAIDAAIAAASSGQKDGGTDAVAE